MTPLDLPPFVTGLGVGVAVAAPVGPMSLLCMRRTLVGGALLGLATGAGIAVGDGLYALVAAFGLAGIMQVMIAYERPLHAVAGVCLMYLGWRAFAGAASARATDVGPLPSLPVAGVGAALLTLTNPPTVVSFITVFAAVAPAELDAVRACALAAGAFAGSLLWWILVTALVGAARHSLGPRSVRWIDRTAGAALAALGAAELRGAVDLKVRT